MSKCRILLLMFIIILSCAMAGAEGIRDEIFYLNQENNLSININNFNKLNQDDAPVLIEILAESKEDRPIKTIAGELKVSAAAKNTIMLKLAEFGDKRAREIVEWYMEHSSDRFSRHIAAVSLGTVGDKNSIAKLKAAAKDYDPALQLFAVRALGELGDDSGYGVAVQYLRSLDLTLKTQAIYALATIGKPEAIPLLKPELESKDCRDVAQLAISKIEYDHLTEKKKPAYLRNLLKKQTGEAVYWATVEFMKLGDKYVQEVKRIAEKKKYPGSAWIKEALAAKEAS
ncbi:MAG: HEAT repeat domain-containing protein [bacterium]|nr:HEAT repeat domain-containing protein [bacterium]MDD5756061.1 HEAT repeat domain-containing protein [bacterium]